MKFVTLLLCSIFFSAIVVAQQSKEAHEADYKSESKIKKTTYEISKVQPVIKVDKDKKIKVSEGSGIKEKQKTQKVKERDLYEMRQKAVEQETGKKQKAGSNPK